MIHRRLYIWFLNNFWNRPKYFWIVAPICDARDYLLRIWFCHHNARVLEDLGYRFGYVLSHTTRGMSKPYYALGEMYTEIDDYQQHLCDEAVADYKKDHDCHCDEDEHGPSASA